MGFGIYLVIVVLRCFLFIGVMVGFSMVFEVWFRVNWYFGFGVGWFLVMCCVF